MNAVKLALSFVRHRPLVWTFNVIALVIGIAVITTVIHINDAMDARFDRDLAGIDLVVGAKGSPMQIILASVFQIDIPTGNIPFTVYERVKRNKLLSQVVPVSMGDNIAGYRIVGTTPEYGKLYQTKLQQGSWWTSPMQAVIGSEVARTQDLQLGDRIIGEHGLLVGGEKHDDSPYIVVGILKPSGSIADRLVLTDIASIWSMHEHEATEHDGKGHYVEEHNSKQNAENELNAGREVTAILIQYKSPMAAILLPRMLNKQSNVEVAVPAQEMLRLRKLLGTGSDVLRWFGVGLLLLAALGFFMSLLAAVLARQRELSLLRALGAPAFMLVKITLIESFVLGAVGGVIGVLLGHASSRFIANKIVAQGGPMLLPSPFNEQDIVIVLVAVAISMLAAFIPALLAYRINVGRALQS